MVFGAAFAIFGTIFFCIYYFNKKQKIIRTLKKLPLRNIGSLQNGKLSKITGKALHITTPLIAPLSKRKCVFYTIKIEQKKSRGKNSYWDTIINEEEIQDFFIEKNSDYVIINPVKHPKNYISYLVVDKKTSSGTFNDASIDFENLLKNYNLESTGFLGFNKNLRYSEAIIEIGEEITVTGIANWKSLSEPIDGYSYSKIATLEHSEKQKIIITDLHKSLFNKR